MSGTKPKFMENSILCQNYYLLELSRYAKKCGKKLIDLTQEEIKKFSI